MSRAAWLVVVVALAGMASACGRDQANGTVGIELERDAGTGPLWSARVPFMNANLTAIWGSGSDVFVAGQGGQIAHSADRGATFTLVSSGLPGQPVFRRFSGSGASDVWLVGEDDGAAALLHSGDRGASWQPVDVGSARDLRGVWSLDGAHVLVATGQGEIWSTEDGGTTWGTAYRDARASFDALWGGNGGLVYAAGGQDDSGDTSDGAAGEGIEDGCDGGSAPMTVSGRPHGLLLRSTDGGATWSSVGLATAGALTAVWGTTDGRVVATSGANASLAWTWDHGEHWLQQSRAGAPPDEDLDDVWVGPGDAAFFFASPSGLIRDVDYRCDGPVHLLRETLPAAADAGVRGVAAVWGLGSDDVWAVGAGGAIWHRP
jgi:photosystem II stability/assembly factor-like uncharacterized protein